MKAAHVLIITAILASVIGTFFAANTINGLAVAKNSLGKADFAAVTGKAVDAGDTGTKQAEGLQAAMSALLFALVSIAALVIVGRIGQNSYAEIKQNSAQIGRSPIAQVGSSRNSALGGIAPKITDALKKVEDAIQTGSHDDAFALYNIIRQQYGQLSNGEKAEHYRRIISIHRQLSRQAAIMEAQRLTDKYVKGTISEEEFERLKQLIVSQ
ncbi:hypothetical protein HYU20_02480 [Candidatus Woesearchaeota archaeon]|nr:hypothetical protein [Candidatus Woesearchaeota archaeon]